MFLLCDSIAVYARKWYLSLGLVMEAMGAGCGGEGPASAMAKRSMSATRGHGP